MFSSDFFKNNSLLNNLRRKTSQKEEAKKIKEKEKLDKLFLAEDKTNFTKKELKFIETLVKTEFPKEYRIAYWLIASGAKKRIINNPNYYSNLVDNYPDYIPSAYEIQIVNDLKRTFPFEVYFQNENNIKKLKNILIAYSRRCNSIGYCQGFNFIVARLLTIIDDEEKVFWIFTQILEELLPLNYFSLFTGIMIDVPIMEKLISMFIPEFYQAVSNLEGQEICIKNIMMKIQISLYSQFTNTAIFDTMLDSFFLKGNIVFFYAALLLMSEASKCETIKQAIQEESESDNPILEAIGSEIQKFILNYDNIKELKSFIFENDFAFDIDTINKERFLRMDDFYKLSTNKKKKNEKNAYIDKQECDLDWPICLYDTSYRYRPVEFLVYTMERKAMIIDDFFYGEPKFNYQEINEMYTNMIEENELIPDKITEEVMQLKKKIEIYAELIIERNKHVCESKMSTKNKIFCGKKSMKEKKNMIDVEVQRAKDTSNLIHEMFKSQNAFGLEGGKLFKEDELNLNLNNNNNNEVIKEESETTKSEDKGEVKE